MFLCSNTFLGLAVGCRLTVSYGVQWGRGCGGRAGTTFWELRSNLPHCEVYGICIPTQGRLFVYIGLNAGNFRKNFCPHSKRELCSFESHMHHERSQNADDLRYMTKRISFIDGRMGEYTGKILGPLQNAVGAGFTSPGCDKISERLFSKKCLVS